MATNTKIVYTGLEGSGKSLQLSRISENVLRRNKRWLRITGVPRTMAFNTPMSEDFISRIKSVGCEYKKWTNFDEIGDLEDCDIFIDELIKYFPAGVQSLSNEQLHFITQGQKSGIYLYCASQDFSQVHKQFRRLVNQVYVITKLIGSRRPMRTSPPVKRIWGVCFKRNVVPSSFKGDTVDMKSVGFPSFFFIEKIDTQRFDTSFKIPLSTLPTKYVRKQLIVCKEDHYTKTVYV